MNKKWNLNKNFNLSIIPVSSQKIPFKEWKQYQQTQAPIEDWWSHYHNQGTIGIITGRISGNLEVIDVDVKNDPKKTIWEEFISLIPTELFQKLTIQTTPITDFILSIVAPMPSSKETKNWPFTVMEP